MASPIRSLMRTNILHEIPVAKALIERVLAAAA